MTAEEIRGNPTVKNEFFTEDVLKYFVQVVQKLRENFFKLRESHIIAGYASSMKNWISLYVF